MGVPSAAAAQNRWDFFRVLALSGCCFWLFSVLFLAITVPMLYHRLEEERALIEAKSIQFKENSNRIWPTISRIGEKEERKGRGDRLQRSLVNGGGVCQGCKQLTCPPGQVGPPGDPGEDGRPAESGQPGIVGVDGLDLELGPEEDQPCIVCPTGPPGMRGYQGERGQPGPAGVPGEAGQPGQPGVEGPQGVSGPRGGAGEKGNVGFQGPPGDSVVAGVGTKGSKGPPGPAGPVGGMGMAGKPAMGQELAGSQGQSGPQGAPGQSGPQGLPGEPGMPGEPGGPSMFCPSDCGVSHIKVPGFGRQQYEPEEGTATAVNAVEYGGDGSTASRSQSEAVQRRRIREDQFGAGGGKKRRGKTGEIRRHPIGGYYWHS